MRLASLPQRRDGRLIVVSSDLAWYADADHIVPTLQAALDDWERYAPLLDALTLDLEHEVIPRRRFHEREACAPLPRVYRRLDGGRDLPGDALAAGRAELDGPCPASSVALCAVTDEVAKGAARRAGLEGVRLVGLIHDAGLGALSPVLATPDALEREGLALWVERSGQPATRNKVLLPDLGALVSAAAAGRALGTGTIVSGPPLVDLAALGPGDSVRIELRDGRGKSLFGALERRVHG